MIPEHEAQAMRERGAYLVDRVNLDRLARQVMSAEEAAAFVVLVEAHAVDLARLLEERKTLVDAFRQSPCSSFNLQSCLERAERGENPAGVRCPRCSVLEALSAPPEEARDDA